MYWTGNYQTVELNLTKKQAAQGSHQGDCEADVLDLMEIPGIKRQLSKINPDKLRQELKEYGAWDDQELNDHEANLKRIVWLAASDITENNGEYELIR